MITLRLSILISFFIGLFSCTNNNVTNEDIDKFISKYQNEDFENLKGISIFQRSGGVNEIVYGIGKYQENKPLYFVEFNTRRKSITKINKTLLEKENIQDYLTEFEIKNAIAIIRKYDFFLLTVDSTENVFINPFTANAPAYFLRLKVETGDSIIKKGYVYKLYKKNWYITNTK
jgi:hypothetical protein